MIRVPGSASADVTAWVDADLPSAAKGYELLQAEVLPAIRSYVNDCLTQKLQRSGLNNDNELVRWIRSILHDSRSAVRAGSRRFQKVGSSTRAAGLCRSYRGRSNKHWF